MQVLCYLCAVAEIVCRNTNLQDKRLPNKELYLNGETNMFSSDEVEKAYHCLVKFIYLIDSNA